MDDDYELIAFFVKTISDPTIESCNQGGGQKDTFEISDTIYVIGDNYPPSSTFDFYIVENVESWTNNMTIPERVPGSSTTISSNADGWIPPIAIWSATDTVGNYDIIVDINGNGIYETEIDALDDNDIEVTDGFVIIPEISTWIMLLTFIIATLAVISSGKKPIIVYFQYRRVNTKKDGY